MNCEFCRKNMQNLIDNNLTKEQKAEMINHIKGCESCHKKYNYEKKINDDFKNVLHDYDPGFVSSRKMIMSKIDKDKYPLSLTERTGYKLKRNKGIAAAAAVVIIAVSAAFIAVPKLINAPQAVASKNSMDVSSSAASKPETDKKESDKTSETNKDASSQSEEKQAVESGEKTEEVKSIDVFSKDVPSDSVIKSMTKDNQTPWEENKENKYSACVLGKGEYAEEEGYASLIIKSDKGSITEYKLKDEQSSQTTIVQTEWLDKDRILVTIGSAYGTLVSGQKIYSININTGDTELAFVPETPKTQRIKKMESKGDGYLQITITQYTDEALNNYKETIKTIRL